MVLFVCNIHSLNISSIYIVLVSVFVLESFCNKFRVRMRVPVYDTSALLEFQVRGNNINFNE